MPYSPKLKKKRYNTADFILSHNDSDHFDGLPHLIEAGVISRVYTLLLLKDKYREKLLRIMGNYIKDETLIERIKTEYNNIYSLDGSVSLEDALDLGWKILADCFEPSETGIKSALVEKYWPKKN